MTTANKISLVSDRVARAKSLLLSQFKDKPNINALVDALVSELQELENVVAQLQTVRTLDGAYGYWLDQIGAELDVPRGNYQDNDYKTAIKIAMARQSASASVDDIIRIVQLITSDTSATVVNPSHYLMELWSYLFCVSDSYEGLENLAKLFPLNTRVRLVKHDIKPFKFNTTGRGFGSGSTLNSLVYYRAGHSADPRFVSIPTQDIPPIVTNIPSVKVAPYIYGDITVGSVLTVNVGEFNGDLPITITKQWLRDGFDISGQTSNTYTVLSGDAGKNISCKVTATNAYGVAIAYTNNVVIDTVIPPVKTVTTNAGLQSYSAVKNITYTGSPATSTLGLTISKDGTVKYYDNGVLDTTLNYVTSPATNVGHDYKVSYQVISGSELVGLNQNASYTLSSDLVLTMSITSTADNVKTGTYRFTLFKTSDPTDSVTVTITLTTEIVSNL